MKVHEMLALLEDIPPDWDIEIINGQNSNCGWKEEQWRNNPTIIDMDIESGKPFTYNTKLTIKERLANREYYQLWVKAVKP